MDPYAVLGVAPTASPEEIARAYRARAKEWHPDVRGTEDALRRMALINAAYERLRDDRGEAPAAARRDGARPRRRAGDWLPDAVRRELGPELLAALARDEPVELVMSASTWASPQTLLAVTDRRLLWLLDDAISHRVRSLAFTAITGAELKQRRRTAALRISRHRGRPIEFAELMPEAAHKVCVMLRA